MSRYRYGPWRGGRDPLTPPFDLGEAVDRLGEQVLDGASPQQAMRQLLRRGLPGAQGGAAGLDALQAQARRRRDRLRRGDLAGVLDEARALLDRALRYERDTLAARPDDTAAREAEQRLDEVPADLARAVRDLADYRWHSSSASAAYEQIRDLVRRDVLGQQLQGRRAAAAGPGQGQSQAREQARRVTDMLADLNALLAAHSRGEPTDEKLEQFLRRHGDDLDPRPESIDDLVDALADRAAAAQRLLDGLDSERRRQLADMVSQALADDPDLENQLMQLRDNLRALRPGLDWSSRPRLQQGPRLGYVEATDALSALARLDDLIEQLGQDYPGASLDDVDAEALQRELGSSAAGDLAALRALHRGLLDHGWLVRTPQGLQLSARAVRRLGQTALRRALDPSRRGGRGAHDQNRAGAAGEPTGGWRAWEMGDEQPLDVVRTLQQALVRRASEPAEDSAALQVGDFVVAETEARTSAAVALLVDLSYSMAAEGRWGPMKQAALALHHVVSTRFRHDHLAIIGFDRSARPLTPGELAGVEPSLVQGTNLQHALLLAERFVRRHAGARPVVLVVTDGEPTAHLQHGEAVFSWPPLPQTVALTLAQVDELTRLGAALTVVMLGDDPGLHRFVQGVARRSGGRVLTPSVDRLGEYVVDDYVRSRRRRG